MLSTQGQSCSIVKSSSQHGDTWSFPSFTSLQQDRENPYEKDCTENWSTVKSFQKKSSDKALQKMFA